jgi:hypothetical protein
MLTVISGIFGHSFFLTANTASRHDAHAPHLALSSSSAKADDPVFRAASVQLCDHGILDARFRGHDGLG